MGTLKTGDMIWMRVRVGDVLVCAPEKASFMAHVSGIGPDGVVSDAEFNAMRRIVDRADDLVRHWTLAKESTLAMAVRAWRVVCSGAEAPPVTDAVLEKAPPVADAASEKAAMIVALEKDVVSTSLAEFAAVLAGRDQWSVELARLQTKAAVAALHDALTPKDPMVELRAALAEVQETDTDHLDWGRVNAAITALEAKS